MKNNTVDLTEKKINICCNEPKKVIQLEGKPKKYKLICPLHDKPFLLEYQEGNLGI